MNLRQLSEYVFQCELELEVSLYNKELYKN